jgi:hypothetical protein
VAIVVCVCDEDTTGGREKWAIKLVILGSQKNLSDLYSQTTNTLLISDIINTKMKENILKSTSMDYMNNRQIGPIKNRLN